MEFSTKVAVKLLVDGVESGENKNTLTSPLSYASIMNMIAAGSSADTLDQILQFLKSDNIEEVHSEFSKFVEITRGQTNNNKINDNNVIEKRCHDVQQPRNNPYGGYTRNIIKYPANEDGGGPIIASLNGVWVNKNYVLKDSFQELVENIYKARVRNIDCEKPQMVVQEINEWASASTKGLINEILEGRDITSKTILILGNSLYFKGSWVKAFDKGRTKNLDFYLLNGEEIKAPFMTGCKQHSHRTFQDFQVARIPYRVGADINRNFAMYIFLPNEKDGLPSLLRNVHSDPNFFERYCDLGDGKRADVFLIPKFKFSYLTRQAKDTMKDMGLTLPFDKEKAEFYEMIVDGEKHFTLEKLHVTTIVQKTFIEVNEEGTEAAAVTFATYSGFLGCAMPKRITEFIADHPFMFIIREEISGVILFSGTLLNPSET